MGRPNATTHRVLMLSMALSLVSSTVITPQTFAMSMPGTNKKGSSSSAFQLPAAEKIDTSDSSTTEEKKLPDLSPLSLPKEQGKKQAAPSTKPDTSDEAPWADKSSANNSSSNDSQGKDSAANSESSNKEVLNGNITTSNFVPKGPLEGDAKALLAPTSVKGSKMSGVSKLGGSLIEQAKSVSAAPIPLIESAEETDKKVDEEREIEREQLTGLWEAALTRTPEINFVIQKLMPSSDPSKVTTVMMRLLSTALMAGAGTMQMMVPSPGTYVMSQSSMSVMGNLLGMVDSNAAKKAKLTQTEQIQMFMMVRGTADKLVDRYRDYKICHRSLQRANSDFEDLKRVAAEIRKNMDPTKQFETDYTLRRQQRDIEQIGQTLSKHRQFLLDMSGPEAVAKLDQQIDEELRKLHPELVLSDSQSTGGDFSPLGIHVQADASKDSSRQDKTEAGEQNKQLADKHGDLQSDSKKESQQSPL